MRAHGTEDAPRSRQAEQAQQRCVPPKPLSLVIHSWVVAAPQAGCDTWLGAAWQRLSCGP